MRIDIDKKKKTVVPILAVCVYTINLQYLWQNNCSFNLIDYPAQFTRFQPLQEGMRKRSDYV